MLPLALSLSTPVVLLAWSFISFILAVVTYAWVVPAVKVPIADTVKDIPSHFASPETPLVWSVAGMVIVAMSVCGLAWLFLPRGFATRATSQEPRAPSSTVVKWSASRIWTSSKRKTSLHSKKEQSKDDEERVASRSSSRRPSVIGSPASQDDRSSSHLLDAVTADLSAESRRIIRTRISFVEVPMPDTMVHHPTGKTPPHHQRARSGSAGGSLFRSSSTMPLVARSSPSRATTPLPGPVDDYFPVNLVTSEGAASQARTDTEDTVRAVSQLIAAPISALQAVVPAHEGTVELLFESPSPVTRPLALDVGIRPPDLRVHLSDNEDGSRHGSSPPEQYTSSSASSLGLALGVHVVSASPPPITVENPRAMALDALVLALQTALNEFRDTAGRERLGPL